MPCLHPTLSSRSGEGESTARRVDPLFAAPLGGRVAVEVVQAAAPCRQVWPLLCFPPPPLPAAAYHPYDRKVTPRSGPPSRSCRRTTRPGSRRSTSSSPTRSGRPSWPWRRTTSATPSSSSSGRCGTRAADRPQRAPRALGVQRPAGQRAVRRPHGRPRPGAAAQRPARRSGVESNCSLILCAARGLVLRAGASRCRSRSSSSSTASGAPGRSGSGIPTRGSTSLLRRGARRVAARRPARQRPGGPTVPQARASTRSARSRLDGGCGD